MKIKMDDVSSALVQAQSADIALWTDEKRNDFVETFHARIRVSRCLLEMTASKVLAVAKSKSFISDWHTRTKRAAKRIIFSELRSLADDPRGYESPVGGRDKKMLSAIADERAQEVLRSLPPLSVAVQVIDPETSTKIKKVKDLKDKGSKLGQQLEELSKPVVMADLDQGMTIGVFRKMVKTMERKREGMLRKVGDIGHEATTLQRQIDEKLYKGLPGLSDAVIDTVVSFLEQSQALDNMSRRVEEQVKFGESEAAMEMLRRFEKDETTVSQDVADRFATAMQMLKLKGRKSSKKKVVKK